MKDRPKDKRTGDIKRQPSRIGKLLRALRTSVQTRALDPDANEVFRKYAAALGSSMSRMEASEWVKKIAGFQISADSIRRIEDGQKRTPSEVILKALLTSYGLSDDDVENVLLDPNLNANPGANPHLIQKWRHRNLALGEFGPLIRDAYRLGDHTTAWIESEKSGEGGFRIGEVSIFGSDDEIVPPDLFVKRANDVSMQNDERKKKGIRGWSDNKTFCLASVVSMLSNDAEERNLITLTMQQSWYRYNVIAKQEAGADFRWQALQDATHPIKPVPFLASGVGICLNVVCDGGKSIVLGQRSDHETFRKGEYDVAVVEGIRPQGDMEEGKVDVMTVARRALSEELGLDSKTIGVDIEQVIKRLVVFEFGCDLEFYQWNFIGFAEVDLDFDSIYGAWQKAKDRKENQTIRAHPFDKEQLESTFTQYPIWSSGIACAMRTFDYY